MTAFITVKILSVSLAANVLDVTAAMEIIINKKFLLLIGMFVAIIDRNNSL